MSSLEMTLQIEKCVKLCKNISNTKSEINQHFGAPPMVGTHAATQTAKTLNTPCPSLSDSGHLRLLVHLLSSEIFLNPFFHLVHNSESVLHIFVFHSLNIVHPDASLYFPSFYSVQNYLIFFIQYLFLLSVEYTY